MESAVYIPAGETLVVALNTWGDTNGYAIADAVRVDWAADLNPGNPLHATELGTSNSDTGHLPLATRHAPLATAGDLTTASVQGALHDAVVQWQSTGLSAAEMAQLSSVQVQAASLPGTMLGYALADSPIIYFDHDAAGYGWNLEAGRSMDLTTVLAHELGHVLGHDDLDPTTHARDIMSATLEPSIQKSVIGQDVAISEWESRIDDVWSAFGEFDGVDSSSRFSNLASRNTDPASRTAHPASRITDTLFAHLDDGAGAMADDYGSLLNEDDSAEEAEDGLDVWSLLHSLTQSSPN
jgi:hypothetical protein